MMYDTIYAVFRYYSNGEAYLQGEDVKQSAFLSNLAKEEWEIMDVYSYQVQGGIQYVYHCKRYKERDVPRGYEGMLLENAE
jgi:hypothetical protein